MTSILIIDDEEPFVKYLSKIFNNNGYETITAANGKEGIEMYKTNFPDVVIIDLRLPDTDGLTLFKQLKEINTNVMSVILTAYADVKSAVEAMKVGVVDYLVKPCDKDELLTVVDKCLKMNHMQEEISMLKSKLSKEAEVDAVFGESQTTKIILSQIKEVAPTGLSVVLTGESGVGKEIFAKMIHKNSLRKNNPFIAIDCGALPETLVESELFGYERGAFTGADRRKLGLFEVANTGTLFLDEIGNLTLSTQAKLLRVLQDKKVQHLGGRNSIDVDVRVITATNINLEDAVRKGTFREDLYYRIAEFIVKVPPLRDRKEDLPALVEYFMTSAGKEFNKKVSVSKEAIDCIKSYNWPGNIRELKNVIKRAVLLAEDVIQPIHLQISVRVPTTLEVFSSQSNTGGILRETKKQAVSEVERKMILDALKVCNYNKSKVAKMLGVTRRTLYKKLHQLGVMTLNETKS